MKNNNIMTQVLQLGFKRINDSLYTKKYKGDIVSINIIGGQTYISHPIENSLDIKHYNMTKKLAKYILSHQ